MDDDLLANCVGSSNTMPTALNSNPSTYVRRKKVKKAKWVFVPQTYTIQLFYNPSDGDEGMLCVDQKAVTTELSGDASFDFTAPCPLLSSGTVTAAPQGLHGSTSEFSEPLTVG